MTTWIDACGADDIEQDGAISFNHKGRTFAIYRTEDDRYFTTDGLCSHEQVELADGFLEGTVIECPAHAARFDITSGAVLAEPACEALATYPVKVEDGRVLIGLD